MAKTSNSTGTTWALYALTQNQEVQRKLREELLTVGTDNPTMDELNALPYLDMVVRETLRVHAPVPSTIRIAMKDDILPLNTPFTDRKGRVNHEIRYTLNQASPLESSAYHVSQNQERPNTFDPDPCHEPPQSDLGRRRQRV